MRYFNAPDACRITGTAMNLTPTGIPGGFLLLLVLYLRARRKRNDRELRYTEVNRTEFF